MNAQGSNLTGLTAEELTAKVRLHLSHLFIERLAKMYGMEKILAQSQSWEGFARAFRSWHQAQWRQVDEETPSEVVSKVVKALQVDEVPWSKAPTLHPTEERPFIVETIRQQYIQHRALFLWAMDGIEATDPDTYRRSLHDMRMAERVGDDTFFRALARQKQQKPTRDRGDRRLKYLLLLNWISGCLWAFTTDGIAALLQARYPRTEDKPYHPKTISDAWRDRKLYRLPKPLWWGIAGQPPQLVPR